MQAETKMAGLTKFCQTSTGDLYANYIMGWAELTILTNFSQIHQRTIAWRKRRFWRIFFTNSLEENLLAGLKWRPNVNDFWMPFMQITSPEMALTCWRIWWFWRFLFKVHDEYYARKPAWDGIFFVLQYILNSLFQSVFPEQNGNGNEYIFSALENSHEYYARKAWNGISFVLKCILHSLF